MNINLFPLKENSNNLYSIKFRIWVPEREIVKIIDLGGATFDYEYHSTIINTR